jgi:iron complex outermembrane recepter protein
MFKYNLLLVVLLHVFAIYTQEFKGVVKDAHTNEVIPFSKINLFDFDISTLTDVNGSFSFNIKLPEIVRVKVSNTNYQTVIKTVNTSTFAEIFLEYSHLELDEIVISTGKNDQLRNSVTPIEIKKLSELKMIPTSNLGEALNNVTGVYVSTTGNGISKPVIRGLQGNQVVTYLNGIRIENQQWGGDHGMGMNDLGLDQVEIIKGPASLQFGGDALGGVIYLSDENYTKQNTKELAFQTQFETNTLGTNNRIEYKKAHKNFRYNLAGLVSNHADYRLSNGKFAGNSRFSEQAFKGALSFNKNKWVSHLRYNFSNNHFGIPGHTHDTSIVFEKFQYLTQKRNFATPVQVIRNHFTSSETKYFYKKGEVNFILGFTLNSLSEFEEKITIPAIKMKLSNYLYHIKLRHDFTSKLSLLSGFQGMYQRTINDKEALEFLIPNGNTLDNGLYSILNYKHNKWNFQGGVRYDTRLLKSTENFKGSPTIDRSFYSLNYSLGTVHNSKNTTFRVNFSNAYRAPHFNELLSNGVHHGSLRYELGNANLKAEQANQIDVLFDYHNEHISVIINPFYTYFQNYIYIEPLDSFASGYTFFEYQQEKTTQIYGLDFGIHYHPHFAHFLHLESSFSTIEFLTNSNNSLPLIPQNRINTFVKLNFKMKSKLQFNQLVLQHLYYFNQNKVSTFELPSRAYHLFNLAFNFSTTNKNPIFIDLGFKNFLNENYINHLSRLKNIQLPNPGWNVYLSLKYVLKDQISNN